LTGYVSGRRFYRRRRSSCFCTAAIFFTTGDVSLHHSAVHKFSCSTIAGTTIALLRANRSDVLVMQSPKRADNTRDATACRLTSKRRKAKVAATLGTIVEYADWIIYATFAPILAGKSLSASNTIAALLSVFAEFAIGFAMRPIC
jgi:hypothetical protein